MSTSATKTVSVQTTAKPKMLSYIYLYRMYKFNKAKERLDKMPGRVALANTRRKKSWISNGGGMHYETLITHYYAWKMRNLAAKKATLRKEISALSAKLNSEAKLSSFVQKQVETKELGFWKSTLRDMKGIVISTFVSMSGAIGMFMVASIAFESLVPGFLQGASPIHAAGVLAIFALSVVVGVRLYGLAENARHVLDIGKEKAEKLASDVKKLAA